MTNSEPIRADEKRLWASLMEMGRIGATPGGGVGRLALTELDRQARGEFEAAGLAPFRYWKKGKSYQMSYHEAPDDALEDAELLRDWARKAVDAAMRAARGQRPKKNGMRPGNYT